MRKRSPLFLKSSFPHLLKRNSQTNPIHLLLVSQSKGLHFSFVCHIIAVHLSLFSQTIILQNEQEIITHTAIER